MRGTPVALVAMLLTALAAGCGPSEEEQPVTLPAVSPSSASPASVPSPSSPSPASSSSAGAEDAVEAVYLGWMAHLDRSQHMSESARRTYLARWLVDPALTQYNEGIQAQKDRHVVLGGKRVPHILGIRVQDTKATLRDCNDLRGVTAKDSRTGEEIPQRQTWLLYKATLERTRNGWRISKADPVNTDSCVEQLDPTPTTT